MPGSFTESSFTRKLLCALWYGRSLSIQTIYESQHFWLERSCREINQVVNDTGERWDSSPEYPIHLLNLSRPCAQISIRHTCDIVHTLGLLKEHSRSGSHPVTVTSFGKLPNNAPAFSKSDLWPHPYPWKNEASESTSETSLSHPDISLHINHFRKEKEFVSTDDSSPLQERL